MKICPGCNMPMVNTFAMAYKEHGCVECDIWDEFFGSVPNTTPTEELEKLCEDRREKWKDDLMHIGIFYGGAICRETRNSRAECECQQCQEDRKIQPKYWRKTNQEAFK